MALPGGEVREGFPEEVAGSWVLEEEDLLSWRQ